jgi:Protein of unknown function (DUF3618)
MRHHERKSPSNIEREVAAQRAEISETLGEIKERLSPGELLEEVLHDSRVHDAVSRIGSAISRNPLPVVLIGVGALWLALSSNRPHTAGPARVRCRGRQFQLKGKP